MKSLNNTDTSLLESVTNVDKRMFFPKRLCESHDNLLIYIITMQNPIIVLTSLGTNVEHYKNQ